ncbi:peptidyl-prolyl cis-trans isomerase fkbp12 [Phtheirospermum japonicum]|uniref:peptidylprolyl isomerase n=1 Tax=Phtheirospermum japonicum TaxID=374723 RepID=A0A830CED7_9LAMI|nr:peptidyl-prolyl cis-trans isomerase fkbp12 [Phtheirospermum japonicum]
MLAHPIRAMGVGKELLRAGTGPKPVVSQNVTVHCTDFGKNGDLVEKFWSTKDLGQKPFSFQIGQGNVVKGWDEVKNASRRSLV